MMKIWFYCSL